jgi:hypothetical protein
MLCWSTETLKEGLNGVKLPSLPDEMTSDWKVMTIELWKKEEGDVLEGKVRKNCRPLLL